MYPPFFVGQPIPPLNPNDYLSEQQMMPPNPVEALSPKAEEKLLDLESGMEFLNKFKPLTEAEDKEYRTLLDLSSTGAPLSQDDVSRLDALQARKETSGLAQRLLTPMSDAEELRRMSLTEQAVKGGLSAWDQEELGTFWQRMETNSYVRRLLSPWTAEDDRKLELLESKGGALSTEDKTSLALLFARKLLSTNNQLLQSPLNAQDVSKLEALWPCMANLRMFFAMDPKERIELILILMRLGFGKSSWDKGGATTQGWTVGNWGDWWSANWGNVVVTVSVLGAVAGTTAYYLGWFNNPKKVVGVGKKRKKKKRILRPIPRG